MKEIRLNLNQDRFDPFESTRDRLLPIPPEFRVIPIKNNDSESQIKIFIHFSILCLWFRQAWAEFSIFEFCDLCSCFFLWEVFFDGPQISEFCDLCSVFYVRFFIHPIKSLFLPLVMTLRQEIQGNCNKSIKPSVGYSPFLLLIFLSPSHYLNIRILKLS